MTTVEVCDLKAMLRDYLRGDVDAACFAERFVPAYLRGHAPMDVRTFHVLDEMFAAADMYTEDAVLLADPAGLYVPRDELEAIARRALATLDAFDADVGASARRQRFLSDVLAVIERWRAGELHPALAANGLSLRMHTEDAGLLRSDTYWLVHHLADALASARFNAQEEAARLAAALDAAIASERGS